MSYKLNINGVAYFYGNVFILNDSVCCNLYSKASHSPADIMHNILSDRPKVIDTFGTFRREVIFIQLNRCLNENIFIFNAQRLYLCWLTILSPLKHPVFPKTKCSVWHCGLNSWCGKTTCKNHFSHHYDWTYGWIFNNCP